MRRALILALLAAALAWAVADNLHLARPVVLPDVSLAEHGGKLQCVSYAPYRLPGQTPFDETLVIPPEQIDADLAALAKITQCVRTYAVQQGLEEVPRLAHKHGLQVLLGFWIGRDRAKNEREIARGLEIAARDPAAIRAIIVGNEVLLRRDQPPAALRGYLEQVRKATTIPVTYADVWEFWVRNAALAEATTFVTAHILPYWEDDPVPVMHAITHIIDIHREVRKAFPGKDILVGETGWPSAGRNRAGAQPGTVEQARFVREFLAVAARENIRYNLIEAVDQPWKRALEGTVGGHWGMLDANLKAKFPLTGPVDEAATARLRWWGMAIGAALLAAATLRGRRGATALIAAALAGALAGQLLVAHTQYAVLASKHWGQWLLHGALLVLGAVTAWAITNRLTGALRERLLRVLRGIWLGCGAVAALLLAFNPRYRDFPVALYAIGYGGLLLAYLAGLLPRRAIAEERVLAWMILACVPVILWHEGLRNPSALLWCALCLAGAAPIIAGRSEHRHDQRDGG